MLSGLGFPEAYVPLPLAQHPAIVIVMLTTCPHPIDLARAGPLPKAKVAALLQEHCGQQAAPRGGSDGGRTCQWPVYCRCQPGGRAP